VPLCDDSAAATSAAPFAGSFGTNTIEVEVATTDPTLVITQLEPMATLMGKAVASERYRAVLSSMFGLAALALASIGLYGLLARLVADRQREIGVRMALGASPNDVLSLVVRDGVRLVLAGLAIGVPIALGAAQLIRTQLLGVVATAPHIIVAACGLLAAASIAAALVPARRASRVDPIVTLRAN
jgi:ABC-type antimicrobial peptide transport system permease subunit